MNFFEDKFQSSSEVLDFTQQLISKPSITPDDYDCQLLISEYLEPLGFEIENMPAGNVKNLWAVYNSNNSRQNSPCLVFAGHTDVVPTGPINQWNTPPFTPTVIDNVLYGRGAADMKGSIAAMCVAIKNFIEKNEDKIKGSIGLIITSDEEGPAITGTKHVVNILNKRGQNIDYCIVGEPSSREQFGDIIKNGRRGSLSGHLTILGEQGHAAYPLKAKNAIHISLKCLQELTDTVWDNGNQDFPPTTFQLINMQAGTGASNVIPGNLNIEFNLRYASSSSFESISSKIDDIIKKHGLKYEIDWKHYAQPFLTPVGEFTSLVQKAVSEVTKYPCNLATDGGSSDGRFIFPVFNCQLIELGPRNHCIHQINEHVSLDDLNQLCQAYENILTAVLLDRKD